MSDEPVPHPHGHEHTLLRGPEELRARGRRLTRQRALIWAALTAEPDRHLSAAEVATRVRAELPRVNASTIYRTLELLVGEGLVLRSDLGADRVFYEPARDHRHHHVVCRECGAVAHVHDDLLGDLRTRIAGTTGFEVGDEELTLFARCPACRQRAAEASGEPHSPEARSGHAHDH
jgi:Fur family transcriptional regulator, ferric uptake regulator